MIRAAANVGSASGDMLALLHGSGHWMVVYGT